MHYFLALVEEILNEPFVPGYAEYLEHKLWPLAEAKAAAARIETSLPTPVRNE